MARTPRIAALVATFAAAGAVVKLSTNNVLFGTAIKNGSIGPHSAGELTVFTHNCGVPPCAITQLHVPSIYPTGKCPFDWENGRLRFYVDGESRASIDVSLLELAHVGPQGAISNQPSADGSPFGNELFGKTARTGGVYSTVRIPFTSSLNVTLQAPPSCEDPSIYWLVIRGIEAFPVVLGGELELPSSAKLQVVHNYNVTLAPLDFLTLASAPSGTSGTLVAVDIDAASADPNYLEGCVRFWPNATASNASEPIFLSSGTEDYFLSASYFDEGAFHTSQSGVTFDNGNGDKSAYKVHASRDYVPWGGAGMQLVWRNQENSCPNGWPGAQGQAAAAPPVTAEQARAARRAAAGLPPLERLTTGPVTVNTTTWMYVW